MHSSAHGAITKTSFSSYCDDDTHNGCEHLDTKNFLPTRLSQRNLSEDSEDNENQLGMGVWWSKSPDKMDWDSKEMSGYGMGMATGESQDFLNITDVRLDDKLYDKSKLCTDESQRLEGKLKTFDMSRSLVRSRSTSVALDQIRRAPSDQSYGSSSRASVPLSVDFDVGEMKSGGQSNDSAVISNLSLHLPPKGSNNNSPVGSPRAGSNIGSNRSSFITSTQPSAKFLAEYLPPTWDPQSDFCFPVGDLTVARYVPDNMELSHFKDIKHIADGSNANVFLANLNEEQVIIKMIREEVQKDPVAVHEFDVEHGILVRVSHPHIIQILGAGRVPRRFVVLEYLGSGSLNDILQNNLCKPGITGKLFHRRTFGFFNLLSKAKDLASALDYLHRRVQKGTTIIHRDLKPDNVGFTTSGQLKLLDFGLCTCVKARERGCAGYEMTGNTGSLRYMAPEVALRQTYSEKVDVYSFGIMLWQMASDVVPFQGLTRDDFMKKVVRGGERPKIPIIWPFSFSVLLRTCWNADSKLRPSFEMIVAKLEVMMK